MVAALPSDLSHSPLLGILGVVMGAGIVTLAGRLLSLGLADLKGNVGIGFDDGAWIASAFRASASLLSWSGDRLSIGVEMAPGAMAET